MGSDHRRGIALFDQPRFEEMMNEVHDFVQLADWPAVFEQDRVSVGEEMIVCIVGLGLFCRW